MIYNKDIQFNFQEKGYGEGFYDGQMNERIFWINRIKNTIEKVKDGTFDAEIILNHLLYDVFPITITKEKLENECK